MVYLYTCLWFYAKHDNLKHLYISYQIVAISLRLLPVLGLRLQQSPGVIQFRLQSGNILQSGIQLTLNPLSLLDCTQPLNACLLLGSGKSIEFFKNKSNHLTYFYNNNKHTQESPTNLGRSIREHRCAPSNIVKTRQNG